MKPDYAALLQDVGRRAEHLVTVRLVAYVSEFESRGTPQLSVRSIGEICNCRPNSAMVAVQEAVSKGWLVRTPHKNSAVFTLGPTGTETSQILRQFEQWDEGENVSNIETLSDAGSPNSAENVSIIETEVGSEAPFSEKTSQKLRHIPEHVSQKLRRFAPGPDFATRAGDSPYPSSLFGSSPLRKTEEEERESPPCPTDTGPLLSASAEGDALDFPASPGNGAAPSRRTTARIQSELRLAFEQFWPLYPRRDDKLEALEIWLRDVRLEDVPDVVQAAILYTERKAGDERRFVKQAKTWLLKGRWRQEFDNARERAKEPPRTGPETPAQREVREAARRSELLRAQIAELEAEQAQEVTP